MPNTVPIAKHYKPLTTSLDVTDPVWKAWRKMKENEVKHLPVRRDNKIVGIVSDRDIVQISGYNGGQSMPVKEAMSLNPLVLSIDTTMLDALKAMLLKEQQHAIVINQDNEICGLFSWESAFTFFLEVTEVSLLRRSVNNS